MTDLNNYYTDTLRRIERKKASIAKWQAELASNIAQQAQATWSFSYGEKIVADAAELDVLNMIAHIIDECDGDATRAQVDVCDCRDRAIRDLLNVSSSSAMADEVRRSIARAWDYEVRNYWDRL